MGVWSKIKHTFPSFWKERKRFLATLGIDAVVWLVLGSILWKVGSEVSRRGSTLIKGQSPDQISERLLLGTPEYATLFQQDLQTFVVMLFSFLILGTLAIVLIGTLKNAVLWNIIEKKEFSRKKLWRWLGVMLVVPFVFILFFLLLGLVRLILVGITSQISLRFVPLMSALSLLITGTGFFLFLSTWFLIFVRKYRVFSSLGETFKWLGTHKKLSCVILFLATLVFFLLQLVLVLVLQPFGGVDYLFVYPESNLIIHAALWILFVAWLRFLVKELVL